MSAAAAIALTPYDWLSLFLHYLSLSLLSIGGAITTAPEMHRYMVTEQHWLTDAQFSASVALAQAAPGPNVLYVALVGWHVGVNAGGLQTGLMGVFVALLGILLPSTTLTYAAARWVRHHRNLRGVRAFKQAMAPIVVSLMLATSWILMLNSNNDMPDWPGWLLGAVSALAVWRSRIHLLWLLAAGALLGWYGLV